MKLGIYGAGGLGREVYELARQCNAHATRWDDFFFIDDTENRLSELRGHPVLTLEEVQRSISGESAELIVAVGEPILRKKLWERSLAAGFCMATLIHPTIYMSETSQFGAGSIISIYSFFTCDTFIGKNVLVQPHAGFGHDCVAKDHAVVSAYVSLGGAVVIGESSYVGMSTVIKEKCAIGAESIIGMGSVVTQDIPDSVIALGNPARIMRRNTEQKVFK